MKIPTFPSCRKTRFYINISGLIILFSFIFLNNLFAQAKMPHSLDGWYNNYMKLYDATKNNMPVGSNLISRAIAGVLKENRAQGTGSFFRTWRPDNKECFCAAAHTFNQIKPGIKTGDRVSFDVYMNYWGKGVIDEDGDSVVNVISGYKSSISRAEVVAYHFSPQQLGDTGPDPDADIILLLIDKRYLPVYDFLSLGYSFENVRLPPGILPNQYFYTMGHPHSSPLRVADDLGITRVTNNTFRTNTFGNNTSGNGGSGSPLLKKLATGAYAVGVVNGPVSGTVEHIPDERLVGNDEFTTAFGGSDIDYSRRLYSTKISAIMPEIIANCWKLKSRQELEQSDEYMKSFIVENAKERDEFNASIGIHNQNQLAAGAASGYSRDNPGVTLVKGNVVNIDFHLIPDQAANTSEVYVIASEIRLTNGFSYTATGNHILEINSVIVQQPGSSTAARSNFAKPFSNTSTQQVQASAGFRISPNPSNTGIFDLTIPATNSSKKYTIKLITEDGKLVEQRDITAEKHIRIDVSKKPHGIYLLDVLDTTKALIYHEKLLY